MCHALVLRGIKEAIFVNRITTAAKIVPLVPFIVICFFAFMLDIFADVWEKGIPQLGDVMHQVRNMMLVTVSVFFAIKGAEILSTRAEAVVRTPTRSTARGSSCIAR